VYAKESCPAAVKNAANKAYAGSKISSCKQERADGKAQYEVKLKIADGKKLILDVAPEGAILLTEEDVTVTSVPSAVGAAFAARYPKAKASAAEKQTTPDGRVTYELAYKAAGKRERSDLRREGEFRQRGVGRRLLVFSALLRAQVVAVGVQAPLGDSLAQAHLLEVEVPLDAAEDRVVDGAGLAKLEHDAALVSMSSV